VESGYDVLLTMRSPEATHEFEELFGAFYARLSKLLYRITGDIGRAEAVAAEAFWRLYRTPPAAKTNLEGWLYRVGVRLALDQLKMDRRRLRYEALASIFGAARNPEQVFEECEQQMRVGQILANLKPERSTLILLRSEGLSYAEIAATLELNPASVGTLLTRAEQAFRKEYLKRYGKP
jgi:RNA polymerase sigma-70 factor (ECF subfamily)